MRILKLNLVLILLGHILGDFYFQTNKMVLERKEKYGAVLKHGIVYALTMMIVLVIGSPNIIGAIGLGVLVGSLHLLIDSMKFVYEKNSQNNVEWITKNVFVIDQVTHLSTIVLAWLLIGKNLAVRGCFMIKIGSVTMFPIVIMFGILSILRPVGIWIAESDLRKYKPTENENKDLKNAGRIIGYWERLIVFILLINQQFGAIGLVLTAKSVARFKEIEANQNLAEYYLIGTLMSMGAVLIIWAFLGVF